VLHAALLPLNLVRLRQIQELVKRIREASEHGDAIDVLLPYMRRETHPKGAVLFQRGDAADRIYVVDKGVVAIPEVEKRLDEGTLFGEVGIFSSDAKRSASAVCAEECDIYSIHRDKVIELFYQNPKFGLFIARLLSRYAAASVDTVRR
jgi:CRP-like cAMP-binding protein